MHWLLWVIVGSLMASAFHNMYMAGKGGMTRSASDCLIGALEGVFWVIAILVFLA